MAILRLSPDRADAHDGLGLARPIQGNVEKIMDAIEVNRRHLAIMQDSMVRVRELVRETRRDVTTIKERLADGTEYNRDH